jgi:CysZ protein
MITGYLSGLSSYLGAIFKIGRYGILKYILISLLIGIGLAYGIHFIIAWISEPVENVIQNVIPFEIGKDYVEKYLSWVISAMLYILTFFIYKYIMLIVLSPILSLISNKIELEITGYQKASSIFSLPKEIMRGIGISLLCLYKELKYTIPLFLLSFIPLFGVVPLILLFFVQAYYFALGCFDYFAERYYNINETLEVGSRNRWELLGVGTGANITFFIPFIGVLIAPLLATIATTEMAVQGKLE